LFFEPLRQIALRLAQRAVDRLVVVSPCPRLLVAAKGNMDQPNA
jgi:hypothetical protein